MKNFGTLIAFACVSASTWTSAALAQSEADKQKAFLESVRQEQAARRTLRDVVTTQDANDVRNEYLALMELRRQRQLPAYESDSGYDALAILRRGMRAANEVRADNASERRRILFEHLVSAGSTMYADAVHRLPMVQNLINRGVAIMLELNEKVPNVCCDESASDTEVRRQAAVVNYLNHQYQLILNQGFQLDLQAFDYYSHKCDECRHEHFCDRCRDSDVFRKYHVNLVSLAVEQLLFVTDPGKLVGRRPNNLDKTPGYPYPRHDRGEEIVALGDPLVTLIVETNATAFAAEDLTSSMFMEFARNQKRRLHALSHQLRTGLEAGERPEALIEDAWHELRDCNPSIVGELRKVDEYIRQAKFR